MLFHLETDAEFYTDLQRAAWSAVAIQIWDVLTNLDLEVKHIWFEPSSSWLKWTFFVVRYFPFVVSLSYRIIELPLSTGGHFHMGYLRIWYITQPLHVYISSVAIQIVMMVRTYALFYKSWRIKYLCISLLFLQSASVIIGIVRNLQRAQTIQPIEIGTLLPHSFVWFGVTSFIAEVVILILTITRYRSHFRTVPIATLLFRDGVFVFAVMALFSLIMVVYPILELPFAAPVLAWNLTLFSGAGSRIILNFQDFYTHEDTLPSNTIQLSTIPNTQ